MTLIIEHVFRPYISVEWFHFFPLFLFLLPYMKKIIKLFLERCSWNGLLLVCSFLGVRHCLQQPLFLLTIVFKQMIHLGSPSLHTSPLPFLRRQAPIFNTIICCFTFKCLELSSSRLKFSVQSFSKDDLLNLSKYIFLHTITEIRIMKPYV